MSDYKVEDVARWDKLREEYFNQNKDGLEKFRDYARIFAGDTRDLELQVERKFNVRGVVAANHINLNTRVSRANLFHHNPTFIATPPTSFATRVFTPSLARVETVLLNDWAIEVNLYDEMRRALIDGLLGPKMVMKLGYAADVGVDTDMVAREQEHAQREDRAFVTGAGRPRVMRMDLHSTHVAQHTRTLALIQSGDIQLPAAQVKKLREHIEEHRDMASEFGERPTETVREETIFCKRRNPMKTFGDFEADTLQERTWVGEALVRRVDEVKADPRYRPGVRRLVEPVDFAAVEDLTGQLDKADRRGSRDGPYEMTIVYEIVDLKKNQVITYAHNSKEPLRVVPYSLARILPSGPFIETSFLENPLTGRGVPLPSAYEAHQMAATVLETLIIVGAKRAVPKLGLLAGVLSSDEIEEWRNGSVGAVIQLANLPNGLKVSDVIMDMPTPKLDPQVFAAADRQKAAIAQHSGLGEGRSMSGDNSELATEVAVREQAADALSEDTMATVDNFLGQIGRGALRLMRKFKTPAQVAEIAGDEALKHWPPGGFADRDIVNDRGVDIVPGSSRRKNSAMKMKSIVEGYSIIAKDPLVPAELRVAMLSELFDALGITTVDWDSIQKQMQMMQLAELQGGGGGQAQPGAEGEGGNAAVSDRSGRRGETPGAGEASGAAQGAANVGGGRAGRGAR